PRARLRASRLSIRTPRPVYRPVISCDHIGLLEELVPSPKPALVLLAALSLPALAENWPQWRGPTLNGLSGEKNLPVKWGPNENVFWKLAMPSKTGATPIIWGNTIFLNVADKDDHLYLWSVDKNKGTVNWKKEITGGNYLINKQNMSSPSPVTDGTSVYVMTGVGILKG